MHYDDAYIRIPRVLYRSVYVSKNTVWKNAGLFAMLSTFDFIYFCSCELSKAVCDAPSLVEVPCSQSQSTQPPLPTTTTPARTTTHAGPIPIFGWRHNPFITTYSCNKVKPKWRDCKKYIAKLFVLNCLCVFYEEVIIK